MRLPRIGAVRLAWPLAAVLFTVGCGRGGPTLAEVVGTVTLDGKPLPAASVEFQPEHGSPSSGTTDSDGVYKLRYNRHKTGAVVGKHIVRISTYLNDEDDRGRKIRSKERIPAKYNVKSELTAEVERKGNTIDFAVDSIGEIISPSH